MIRCLALTPSARRWLADTRSATVLNVFERACNLLNDHGAVLSIVTTARGLTPFAIQIDAGPVRPFEAVRLETPIRLDAGRLEVGGLRLDADGAPLWQPRPDWAAVQLLWASEPSRLGALAAAALAAGKPGSLLDLWASAPVGGLMARVRRGAAALVDGLASGSADRAVEGAVDLAGLGGGLTPAGDDFIIGAMLAAWAGLLGDRARRLCPAIAEAAAPRTTTLSAAYLRAAAAGECAIYWHALFEALKGGGAVSFDSALADLISVGHTSGADALAGFLAGHTALTKEALS